MKLLSVLSETSGFKIRTAAADNGNRRAIVYLLQELKRTVRSRGSGWIGMAQELVLIVTPSRTRRSLKAMGGSGTKTLPGSPPRMAEGRGEKAPSRCPDAAAGPADGAD